MRDFDAALVFSTGWAGHILDMDLGYAVPCDNVEEERMERPRPDSTAEGPLSDVYF